MTLSEEVRAMSEDEYDPRARTRELAAEYGERGDATGWFEALYKESAGNTELIPWADLEPNAYFSKWAKSTKLKGNGRTALVVGCGLGDDAKYLHDLGFKVTAFDISPTAIEWAKQLYGEDEIDFHVADLFSPFRGWLGAFDFVLEIYTIQPLPIEMRTTVIEAIAAFVAPKGELIVVTRGRGEDDEMDHVPWPLSRKELSRFETFGLEQIDLQVFPPEEENEPDRWVVVYRR